MRINNEDLLEVNGVRVVVSLAASTSLKPIWLGQTVNYSIQLTFTGTPDGTFKLQASDDVGNSTATADTQMYEKVVNWTDIFGSEQEITEGGNHTWRACNAGYPWVRVVWTAAGAGTSPVLTEARSLVQGA